MVFTHMAPSTPSPPPSTSVRTPPAPRLGFHDDWEPFTPRKSARISSQRVAARTPSPPLPFHRQHLASPRATKKHISQSSAAMASPASSPRKKRQSVPDSVRRVPASLTSDNTAAAAALTQKSITASASRTVGMLPTPSKTPQKPPTAKTAASIQTFARNLFPSEETVLSSPRKKRPKKYSGITMESFTAEEVVAPIEIFTDSQDRVPTKDESETNPFLSSAAQSEPTRRRSKRRQVMIPGEGVQSVEDASRREDGMLYVFRGKKFFRKFSENEAQPEDAEELDSDVEASLSRPLTRASIKPRLLFPMKKTQEMLEEEEAATDVEDQMPQSEAYPQTPIKSKHERVQTPEAPKYAPVSPPDTKRTTRSTNKLVDELTPIKRTGRKSPFDSWPRTKEHKAQPATKRAGEPLAPSTAKRART